MSHTDFDTDLAGSVDAVFITTAEGRFCHVNDEAVAMLGYSRDELSQLLATDVVLRAPDGTVEDCLGTGGVGEPQRGSRRVRRKDGSTLEVHLSAIRLPSGDYITVARDLTEHREAEATLRSTIAWFHLIVKQVPAILWTTDTDLRFTSGMGAALKPIGIGVNEVSGLTVEEFFKTNDPQFPPLDAHRRALAGTPVSYYFQWADRDYANRVEPLRDHQDNIIGVIGLSQDITENKNVERQLQLAKDELEQRVEQRTQELSRANEELREEIFHHERTTEQLKQEQKLLQDLIDMHERDRRITAYEIHDGLVQYLAGSLMRLEAFKEGHISGADTAWENFDTSLDLLRETIKEARRLISGLRPPVLDEAGVRIALEYLLNEFRQATGIQVESHFDIESERFPSPVETALFRIAQEALTNTRKHSQADRIRLELSEGKETVSLCIRDSGVGFDFEKVGPKSFGLRGIRERVRLLGGQYTFESSPGGGTTLQVELPMIHRTPGHD